MGEEGIVTGEAYLGEALNHPLPPPELHLTYDFIFEVYRKSYLKNTLPEHKLRRVQVKKTEAQKGIASRSLVSRYRAEGTPDTGASACPPHPAESQWTSKRSHKESLSLVIP